MNTIDYDPGSDPNTATPFVQVGSARYNRAGPGQIQAVVNRSNLQPIANNSYADNSSGRSALSSYLSTLNSSQLVVVTNRAKHDPRQDRSVLAVHQSVAGCSDLFCHRRPRAWPMGKPIKNPGIRFPVSFAVPTALTWSIRMWSAELCPKGYAETDVQRLTT
jgi:hypothetical protein